MNNNWIHSDRGLGTARGGTMVHTLFCFTSVRELGRMRLEFENLITEGVRASSCLLRKAAVI